MRVCTFPVATVVWVNNFKENQNQKQTTNDKAQMAMF